jgi:ferredoxin
MFACLLDLIGQPVFRTWRMLSEPQQVNPSLMRSPGWRKIMLFYKHLEPGLWLMKLPLIGVLFQRIILRDGKDANWFVPSSKILPVGEEIPVGIHVVLPDAVVESLLKEADGIFAMAACPCRAAYKCPNHSWNIGCLHLGPDVHRISPDLGRRSSLEEGLKLFRRAVGEGLMPTILYNPSTASILQIEAKRMLSLCFCCECCCDVRLLMRSGPDRYWDLYNFRMPGLRVVVGEKCNRCGDCVSACYGAERVITIGPNRAEIHDRCVGCGRCIPACPEGAIAFEFDQNVNLVDVLREKIAVKSQIGPKAQIMNENTHAFL